MKAIDLVEILCSDKSYYWRWTYKETSFSEPTPDDFDINIRINTGVVVYSSKYNVYTKNTFLAGKIVIFKDQFYIVELEPSHFYFDDFLLILHPF